MAQPATSPEALALHKQFSENVLSVPRGGMITAELAAGAEAA